MKKRFTLALAAGALVAAMLPAVASADPGIFYTRSTSDGQDFCAVFFATSDHWDKDFNPSTANQFLRANNCPVRTIHAKGGVSK